MHRVVRRGHHTIDNDSLDISVDVLRNVTLPLLQNFGIIGINLKVSFSNGSYKPSLKSTKSF